MTSTEREQTSNAKRRSIFLDLLFRDQEGFICIAAIPPGGGKVLLEKFYEWPRMKEAALIQIDNWASTMNVYFCTSLLERPQRKKYNALPSYFLWADLDACKPDVFSTHFPGEKAVPPSITVQTSAGRWHGYWLLDTLTSAVDVENINRKIAYWYAEYGCDRSGWDLTQLLRIPYTINHKYGMPGRMGPEVYIDNADRVEFSTSDFNSFPQDAANTWADIAFDPGKLPALTADEIMENYKFKIAPRALTLYQDTPEQDWSTALYQLLKFCMEAGMDEYETFVVAENSACNKWKRNRQPEAFLWKDVCRVMGAKTVELNTYGGDWALASGAKNILTPDELDQAKAYRTFIEEYMDWGDKVSDASPQYHVAGAFIILSAMLSGAIKLPTSYGIVKPNLWFMICADTTLTRKSTAMDMAVDLLAEVIDDAVMATDGSLEGLMAGLSARPNKPSVFLRDEFSGLIDMMKKRDYYAGMMETFTKLYDGRNQKRILRRETLELIDPILLIFAGGIKDRILTLLDADFIASGFIPRFVFTMAESDINRLRPLGPPTVQTLTQRGEILNILKGIKSHYLVPQYIDVAGEMVAVERKWEAELTEEAWAFYGRMETTMTEMALKTGQPDLVTPMYARLCMSGLKAAVLLAAADTRGPTLVVEYRHLLKAFSFVEQWRLFADDVVNNIGRSASESLLTSILRMVEAKNGISRSEVMNRLHLTAKEAAHLFDTLEARGLITMTRVTGTKNWHLHTTRKVK